MNENNKMELEYDHIHAVYFRDPFASRAIDKAVEEKFGVDLKKVKVCMNCGTPLPRTSWLCPYNHHKCIIEFFNKNPELLVEAITS